MSTRTVVLAALALVRCASGANLVAYTYNYAEVPKSILAGAERHVAGAFGRAGIDVTFVECPGSACVQLPGQTALTLKILPGRMTKLWSRPPANFGITIYPHASFVFYDRIQEAGLRARVSIPLLLGDVISHELGHLALGPGSHSEGGIMRENHSLGEYRQVETGTALLFTDRQARSIRRFAAGDRATASMP